MIQKHKRWLMVVGASLGLALVLLGLNRPTSTPNPTSRPAQATSPQTRAQTTSRSPTKTSVQPGAKSPSPIIDVSRLSSPSYRAKVAASDYHQHRYYALDTPNDSLFSGSWYHQTIQSERAWDVTTGSSSVVVADIDTGFALTHEDLVNKWYSNDGEQGATSVGETCWTGTPASKQTNNCDDDQNGYIDDWRGWDFDAGDNDPSTGQTDPLGNGVEHGTMTSGIIGASSDNSLGNAGLNWAAKIMPLQVLADDGSGYTFNIVDAIVYAVDNGANVINMSLGGPDFDQMMSDAIDYAEANGVLVIAASGNCGASSSGDCAFYTNTPGRMSYPARYTPVLSVGATSSTDVRASFSSYGPELDITAPGSLVGPLDSWDQSTPTNTYVSTASGTSFASPIVSGIASLVWSQLASPTPEQVRTILIQSTNKVSGMSGADRTDAYGFGRVNAHKATLLTKAMASPPTGVGTSEIDGRQPPLGDLVRSTSGTVASDEWLVLACRVEVSDTCRGTATNGASLTSLTATNYQKGNSLYYMLISGANLASGTSTLAVHGRNYATTVTVVSK